MSEAKWNRMIMYFALSILATLAGFWIYQTAKYKSEMDLLFNEFNRDIVKRLEQEHGD